MKRNSTFKELVHVHTQIAIITQNTHIICMELTEVKEIKQS